MRAIVVEFAHQRTAISGVVTFVLRIDGDLIGDGAAERFGGPITANAPRERERAQRYRKFINRTFGLNGLCFVAGERPREDVDDNDA